jgi:hypothetical protein
MSDAYPSVAGVAAAASAFARFHPGLCTLRQVGRSREGRPLLLLSAGRGRRNVLVVAGPHSDERIGSATALRLAERVAADPWLHSRADTTWHFLLCLDPDGTVRSEEGPAVRRTPAQHFRHSYRPPADEQPEWAPSVRPAGDQLPESQALVDLIDELQPFLQCSLHGNDLGGSWIQLTRDIPGLAEPLGKLSAERDVPVQTGTYDAMYWTVSGPGVYLMPEPGRPTQFASLPEDVNRSTWVRPHLYGGMTALFEVPMWASRKVADTAPHPDPARALAGLGVLLRHQSHRTMALLAQVHAVLPAYGELPPLLRLAEGLAAICPQVADDWERLFPSPVPLTRAHLTALDIAARRISLRAAGTLLRFLDSVPAALPRVPEARAACEAQLGTWAAELGAGHELTWVPVPDQVDLQSEAVLAAFRLLTD